MIGDDDRWSGEVQLLVGRRVTPVGFRIGAPRPGDRCVECPFELEVDGKCVRRMIPGESPLQALLLCLSSVATEIEVRAAHKGARIDGGATWELLRRAIRPGTHASDARGGPRGE